MPAATTAVFALVIVLFVAQSARVGRLHLTAPIVFTALGFLASRIVAGGVDASLVRELAELTLAVVLFHDAAQVKPRQLRTDAGFCVRLLLIGLPLTILLGLGAAWLLYPGLGLGLALLLAAALAPTDAGLGAATVLNPVVPQRVRRLLNVESGLNDGLATPVVLFAITIAAGAESEQPLVTALEELGKGLVAGVLLGALAGALMGAGRRRGWTEPSLVPVAALAVPLLTYYGSVAAGGNGFVSAFVSGTAFAWALDRSSHLAPVEADEDTEQALRFSEWTSVVLGYVVWGLFGYVALTDLDALTWQSAVFAVLSLTVLRMLPVAVSLVGSGLRLPSVAFIGWFGPRGLASVVFAVLAIESIPASPELRTVLGTMVLTVLLSVILHGITADPWAQRYGAWAARAQPPVETAGSVEPARGRAMAPHPVPAAQE